MLSSSQRRIRRGSVFAFVIISFLVLGQVALPIQALALNNTDNTLDKYRTNVTDSKQLQNTSTPASFNNLSAKISNKFESSDLIAKSRYVSGEILVKYKDYRINLQTASGRRAALNFVRSKSLEEKESLRKLNASVLEIKDNKTVEQAIAVLNNDPNVEYAQPNNQYYPTEILGDDVHKGLLWGLDNTGQLVNGVSGTLDADIDAPEAWVITEASAYAPVIVAVIDSGVAYNHPDLVANMWDGSGCKDQNGVIIPGGCNHGYDFEDGDNTPLPNNSSHGTHIAGIIAAALNNGVGVIGVAPQSKVMALKSALTTSQNIAAINFAKENGAKVINASWAGLNFDQLLKDAIASFPGLFVAAAGNGGIDGISDNNEVDHIYPSDYDLVNIISVAATDQSDNLATFSNYGLTSVDVGAPGTNILSTVAAESFALSQTFESVIPPAVPSGWVPGGTNNKWGTYTLDSGTFWGNVLYGDAINVPYAQTANTTITSETYDLSSGGANIDFWTKCDTEYSTTEWTDYMALEYSADGVNFSPATDPYFGGEFRWDEPTFDILNGENPLNDAGGSVFHYQKIAIPDQYLTGNFKFQFRWVANGNADTGNGDGCLVDDIRITKYSDGSDEQYDYKNGTSVATPHVAGLAALLWGYKPSLTSTEVKNAILDNGDSISSLADNTVTGKRINAFNALDSVTPPIISNVQIATTTATSTMVTWSTDLPATSKVAYSTTTPVSSTIVSDNTLVINHSLALTDLTASTTYYFYTESSDVYGNVATSTEQSFTTLSIPDTTPPVITLNGSSTVDILVGDVYTDPGATALDNIDGDITINIIVVNPVSTSTVGTYIITYNVSDAADNPATEVTRTVNVAAVPDTTAPVITLNGDAEITLTLGSAYTELGAVADDGSTVNITGSVDVNTLGDYVLTYNATDAAGNVATPVTRTIHIVPVPDTTAPVITLNGDAIVNLTVGDSYTDAGTTASDDVDGDITANIVTVNPVDTNVVGSYTVTYNVSDAADNPATEVTRTVNVNAVPVTLNSIAITTPATKLSYFVGEPLDVTGLVVTGTYSDASTAVVSPVDVTGFDSSAPVTGQILTVTYGEKTTTYTVDIVAPLSSAKAIITFDLTTPAATGIINETDHTIAVTVPFETNVTALVPTISITGASINPASGVAQDFTDPVTYTVTAADSSTQTYIVTVVIAPNTAADILSFDSTSPVAIGVIDGTNITLTVPFGTSLTDLPITISLSLGASVLPAAGNTTFVDGVATIYTVTAQDSVSTQNYSVTVIVAANSANDITSFNFEDLVPSVIGVISGANITLNVPYGTDITTLVPTIGITGVSVTPASGVAEDFTDPVIYTVTAADTTTQDYTVTVIVAEPSDLTALITAIATAQAKYDTAVEGNLPGQYPAPLKENLQIAINVASAITNSSSQSVVDAAVVTLNAAVATFEAGIVLPDVIAPAITLIGGNISIYQGTAYTDAGATASDNVDGDITSHIVTVNPVNNSVVGTYTITYNVSDAAGNPATEVTRTVNVLFIPSTSQLLSEDTTVSTSTPEILVGGNNTFNSIITIPDSVTNATINVSALTTSTTDSTTATIQGVMTINASTTIGTVKVEIPAGIQITAGISTWSGIINVPQVKANSTVTVTPDSGNTAAVSSVIEIGYGDIKLTFNKAVRLVLSGQAGKEVGYSRSSVFTKISTVCSADTQAVGDALSPEGDCKISVGSDLIIWTKHFTNFITYTQTVIPTPTPASSSGGGGGGGGTYYYTITASAGTNGSISPDSSTSVAYGSSKTYIITPNAGYKVADVLVDNVSKGSITTYTFSNITTSHTISVIFSAAKLGDANGDNKVDKYDFALMMANWGKTGTNICDFNSDGKVDKYDFALLMSNWLL